LQLASYIHSGKIAPSERKSVLTYLSNRARYAISSITLYELIAGIDGGDEAHFPENRDRLKILYEPAGRECLPLETDFVRSAVFRLSIPAQAFGQNKLKQWIEVILHARTKAELRDGRVTIRGQSYGAQLAPRVEAVRKGKQQDAERLEKLRRGDFCASTPDTWARELLVRMSVPTTAENKARILSAMDAAWLYELKRYSLAKGTPYDFKKHGSDWLDSRLLYYLADPVIHLVTCE
jgi:hypothetical protein